MFSDRVNPFFRGNSSAARILGTRTHCCGMEAMIIDGKMRRKCQSLWSKPPENGLLYNCYKWKCYVPRSVAFLSKFIHRYSCKSLEC